jgi:hypothetical protein
MGTDPFPTVVALVMFSIRDHLNEWRLPDYVGHVQRDCLPNRPKLSPRHAQIAPTIDETSGLL